MDRKELLTSRWSDLICCLAAMLLTCFGLTVLLAWTFRWETVAGLRTGGATLTCDSAFSSILAGLGILNLRRANSVLAGMFGWACVILGGAYLGSDLSAGFFSIHQYLPAFGARTASATPATSVLTTLLGCILLALNRADLSKSRIRRVALGIIVVLAAGTLGVLASLTGVASDPIWEHALPGLTPGTAICCFLAAVSLLALLLHKSEGKHDVGVPLLMKAIGSLSLLLVWAVTQSTGVVYAQIAAQTRAAILTTSSQVAALYAVTRCIRTLETAQRGFLLTGDQVYLEDYIAGLRAVRPAIDALSVFGDRRRDCSKLEVLTSGKLLELAETVRLQSAGSHEAAIAIIRSDVGRRFMTGIEEERNKLATQLKSELATQLAADTRSYRSMRRAVLLAFGLGLILSGFGLALIRRDLQMRRKLEAALRKNAERLEAQLSTIFDTGLVGDWKWNIESGEVTAHPSVWKMWGASLDTTTAPIDWFRAHFHCEDAARLEAAIEGAIREDKLIDLEYRIVHADGSVRWISVVGNVTRGADGTAVQAQGLNIDVTTRKIA